jgi:Ethanolamine utilization protein EutJ (predicted chaperonin)
MRLGIDFGTTRIVVAAGDRGNYPVAAFECPDGASREWMPPLVAVRGGERFYGWTAWALQGQPGVTVVRSLKRVLADCGPSTLVALGEQSVPAAQVLEEMLTALRQELLQRSSLHVPAGEPLQVMAGVPANANSNQRFLTAEGFRSAGFEVLGLLNEPSAASIEYAHRLANTGEPPEQILVYDLGGGTFDVSLVRREERSHAVTATESIPSLGGDDFDAVLADMALEAAGLRALRHALTPAEEFALLEECRERKEALHPNTRRIVVDLERIREGWGQAVVPAGEYYEECRPLVEETLHATNDLLEKHASNESIVLYVTGGASDLPLVGRMLREAFGRRVKRSAYTRSATAIGLAIQATAQAQYVLRERFTRWFGVWREAEGGRRMVFDPLFEKGLALPGPGEAVIVRARGYHPVHNIGHFRYLECSHLNEHGEPTGDLAQWDEIRFPFDPSLAAHPSLEDVGVESSPASASQAVVEEYTADASGSVGVCIRNQSSGYERVYRLARWSGRVPSVDPSRPSRRHRGRSGAPAGQSRKASL